MKLKSLIIALTCCIIVTAQASAVSRPLEIVQSGTDRVLRILREQPTVDDESRTEIRKIVDEYFDFERMAMSTVGPQWGEQPPQKQQEFVDVFSNFLFNTYIERVEQYKEAEISYEEQEIEGNYARVRTVASGPQAPEIPIEYRLHLQNGDWKAYDVVIEGISLVSNYRSQFRSILASDSFDGLIQQLRERKRDTEFVSFLILLPAASL